MKVGIVVPYSWSFWGAVVEHAELQAAALRKLGHDVRLVMGNDPPGSFTRVLHPRLGRHGEPPPEVIPIGRSVIVPANGSLPNIILSPRSIFRIRRVLESERFDLLHLHEPMTPTPCVAALALAQCPLVATFHASGDLSWLKPAKLAWGFLLDRLDHRIAVSEPARESASRYFPGEYELIPSASCSSAVKSRARAYRSCSGRGRRSGGAPERGSAWSAPTRSPFVFSSRGCASRTRESTFAASCPRTS
jgi:phosphatidylinositol alpha-mannosyltransferase